MNYHMHKLQSTLAKVMNMLVTTELFMKDFKCLVLAMKWTSSKRKSFGKKKKSVKRQKVEGGKKKKVELKKKTADNKKYFFYNIDGH